MNQGKTTAEVSGEDVSGWTFYRSRIGDYMDRFILATPFGTLRLHHILRSDEARGGACHDHPFDFSSFLLTNGYDEVAPLRPYAEDSVAHAADALEGRVVTRRWPRFSIVRKRAEDAHRLVLADGPVWTIVLAGPKRRKWGFYVPGRGWTYWRHAEDQWEKDRKGAAS